MSRDIFDDRHGFAAARHAFVTKQPAPTDVARNVPARPSTHHRAEPAHLAG